MEGTARAFSHVRPSHRRPHPILDSPARVQNSGVMLETCGYDTADSQSLTEAVNNPLDLGDIGNRP